MRGDLNTGEAHPATDSALAYISSIGYAKLSEYAEAFASTAIEGNRTAEICHETLRRLLAKEPVSDRYLIGLAWIIRNMEEEHEES